MPAVTTAQPGLDDALTARRRIVDWKGITFQLLLLFTLVVSLAALVTLLADVFDAGIAVLNDRGGDFLTRGLSQSAATAGVWQGVIGTLLIGGCVIVLAFPIGIATAVYLEEYAPDTRFTRFINVNIRNLAGVPSIVFGILGFAIFVKALDEIGGRTFTGGSTVIAAGLTMSVLVMPIVIITAAEALRAVPDSIRQGGYGMGATRWDVIRRLVLPSAAPGILTGTVLSLSRALGETAPLILVGAVTGFFATGDKGLVDQLQGKFTALPMIVYDWARQPSADFRELTAAAIIILLGITLLANAAAIIVRDRYARRDAA